MKKNTLDTILVLLCMLTPISPTIFAKKLVIISTALLILRILGSSNLLYLLKKKLLIFFLFTPSIIMAIFISPEDIIRFVPVLLFVFGFPFYDFKVRPLPTRLFAAFILVYLITTQTLLAFGNLTLIDFRNTWYPNEHGHLWNYGIIDSVLLSLGKFRAGGLYFNPNVLASIVVLYYFMFSISSQYDDKNYINGKKKKINLRKVINIIFLGLVSFSLLFTNSRTAMAALIGYISVKNFDMDLLKKGLIKKKSLWIGLFALIFLFVIYDSLIEGVTTGSANIKFEKLMRYFNNTNFFKVLLGGTFNVQFDNEFGNWIGASGLLGILSWIVILRMLYLVVPLTGSLIVAILLTAIGNTLFYGLLSGSIVIILILITSSYYWQSIAKDKE